MKITSMLCWLAVAAAMTFVVGVACAAQEAPVTDMAVAVLHPTAGSSVSGIVRFSQVEGGVQVVGQLEGLTPGEHGFHIHEFGDCTAPDGTSAGGHFNPTGHPHAGPDAAPRHVGDLGNISADEHGMAHYERVDSNLAFQGTSSILGRGLIVHAKADDLTSQPTGDAGGRLACGVIGVAKQ